MENREDLKKKVADFLLKAYSAIDAAILNGVHAGCHYMPLEDGLFVVAGVESEGQDICAKVACNTSAMQSDFEWGWTEPYSVSDGDPYGSEISIIEGDDKSVQADWLVKCYFGMKRAIADGKFRI